MRPYSRFPETAGNAVIRDLSRRIFDGRRPQLGALLPQRLAEGAQTLGLVSSETPTSLQEAICTAREKKPKRALLDASIQNERALIPAVPGRARIARLDVGFATGNFQKACQRRTSQIVGNCRQLANYIAKVAEFILAGRGRLDTGDLRLLLLSHSISPVPNRCSLGLGEA